MTMPHLMNCPHKGGTWCLKCVGEEWDRREAERDALNARIAELERKAKAFDLLNDETVWASRWRTLKDGPCWNVSTWRDGMVEERFHNNLLTAIEAALAAKEGKQ